MLHSPNSLSYTALDYSDGVYQFVIEPREQEVEIPIPITNDVIVEQLREQFSVDISLQPQPGLSLGRSQGVVTIIDDDGKIFTNYSNACSMNPLYYF